MPVGRPPSTATRASTPSASSSATAARPAGSSPTRATSATWAPATAAHAAVLAACPPPSKATRAGESLPGATGPESRVTTSTITSPTTTMRLM